MVYGMRSQDYKKAFVMTQLIAQLESDLPPSTFPAVVSRV